MVNKKLKKTLVSTLMAIMLVGIIGGCSSKKEESKETQTSEPKPLTIEVPTPSTLGEVKVVDDSTGEVVWEYQGDGIHVISSGKDGEDIEIEIHVPTYRCSCFESFEGEE